MARTGRRTGASDLELEQAASVPPGISEDEADGWFSTHDTSELVGERDVGGGAAPGLEQLSVQVSRREADELRRRGEALGVDPRTYVRLLINRHVLDEEPLH